MLRISEFQGRLYFLLGLILLPLSMQLAAVAPPDSVLELLGSALHLVGVVLLLLGLLNGLLLTPQNVRRAGFRTGVTLARWLLTLALIAATGYGLWSAGADLDELLSLRSRGQAATGQIITVQTVGSGKTTTIAYAFRVGATVVVGQLTIPRSALSHIRTGDPVAVTYLPGHPHVYRLGTVDAARIWQRGLRWLLFLLHQLAWFGLPLGLLARWRREHIPTPAAASLAGTTTLPTK